jgi:peptidoglycan-N-acetylglucosamine deacetylase
MNLSSEWIRIGIPAALGAGAVTASWARVTFAPGSAFWGPVVTRGSAGAPPRVALTFDDGPHPGGTDRILDILADLNIKATFFVLGQHVQQHPRLLAQIHEQGHIIGNHGYDHRGFGLVRGTGYWRRQIDRTDAAIEQIIGVRPRYFRPPLGMKTRFSTRAAARRHISVMWSRRGLDGVSTTPDRILRRLVPRARPGEILLLHDGVSPQSRRDPSATVAALGPLIVGLGERKLQVAALDELIGVQPYANVPGAT